MKLHKQPLLFMVFLKSLYKKDFNGATEK